MSNTLPTITNYGQYSSDNYGANSLRMDMGKLRVWFSYQTPVAFDFDGKRVVRRNQWGPTTGKHLNWIDGGDKKGRVDSATFEQQFSDALKSCGLAQ